MLTHPGSDLCQALDTAENARVNAAIDSGGNVYNMTFMSDLCLEPADQPLDGLSRLIAGLSLEIPPARVAAFEPDCSVLPPGSLVFLPHLGGQDTTQMGAACRRLADRGYAPVPHVSARHLESEQAYRAYLTAAAANGANHVLVLAGDRDTAAGPYSSSLDLIESPHFRDFEFGHVMIGGYPEGHPRIGQPLLTTALRQKLELLEGLDRKVAIVSQFAFDPTAYVTWVRNLRDAGINHEVRLGVAGVTSLPTLLKYAVMCGIGPSLSVLRKQGGAVLGMLGSYSPEVLIRAIAVGIRTHGLDDVNIHFFPFGGATKTLDWVRSIRRAHAGQ